MLSSVLQVTQTCSWHNGQQLYRYVLVLCTALTPCANMCNTSAVQMMVQMSHNCYQVTRYITEHLYAMAKSTKTIVVNWTSTFFEQQLRYPLNDPYCTSVPQRTPVKRTVSTVCVKFHITTLLTLLCMNFHFQSDAESRAHTCINYNIFVGVHFSDCSTPSTLTAFKDSWR
jgi:hypothetical protein